MRNLLVEGPIEIPLRKAYPTVLVTIMRCVALRHGAPGYISYFLPMFYLGSSGLLIALFSPIVIVRYIMVK